MNLNLSQLIRQILGGNRQAFEILIRHYQKLVYGFAFPEPRGLSNSVLQVLFQEWCSLFP